LTVPVLLQTADYARSVLSRSAMIQPDVVEAFVAGRMASQRVLNSGQPPQYLVFVHEAALRLPVGSRQTMSAQLHDLLRGSVRPHIAVRVIPTSAGAHAGLAGSCTLMEFTDFGPVVFAQQETAGYFLEEPAGVAVYKRIFSSLTAVTLGKNESNQLIGRLAVDLYGPAKRGAAALPANRLAIQNA